MRKQFLLLFLMTLLPLAGWAATAAAVDVTGLTLKARTFNGHNQTLLEGTYSLPADYDTSVGGVLFLVTESSSIPDPGSNEGATSEFPQKRDVGLYYIWYKALPDGGTYDAADEWHQVGTTGVRINKAAPTMTAPQGYSDLRYNEGPQALIKTPGSTNLGDMMYSLDQADWYSAEQIADYITGTDVGNYIVHYKAVDGENLKDNTGSIVVRIYGIAPTIQAPVGDETLVYNGAPQQLIATAATLTHGDGTLKYSLDKSNWYTEITDNNLKATTVQDGGYKVYYKMDGGTNYEDIEEHYITVNIAPKSIASDGIVITAGELAFTGDPLVHPTLTVKDGTTDLTQDTDFEIFAEGYNNNKNAGTLTATAAIKGKGNYSGTATEEFTISALDISGLTGALLPSITAVNYDGNAKQPSISWTLSGEYHPTVYNDPNGDYSIVIKNAAQTAEVPNPKDAATYKVIFTGHNNLTGSLTVDYEINEADVTVKANAVNIGVGVDPSSYFGVTYEPALFGTDNLGNITYKVTPNTTTDFVNVNTTAYTDEQVANLAAGTYHIWAIPAGNANYRVTEAYGILTLSAGQIIAKVEDQSVTFGDDFAASQIVHVSGLSAGAKVTAFNTEFATYDYAGNGVEFTIYDENGDVAQPVEGQTYYPVGTYTVKTTGSVTYPNYNVVLDWGTYTVTEKSLEGVACAALSATYAGEDVIPNTTGKLTHKGLALVKGTDYTVELVTPTSTNNVDNKNVSNTTYKGKVKFTAVPGSNYSGSKLVDFTITRKDLTITAVDQTWKYGTDEDAANRYTATVEGLVGDDANPNLDLTQTQANFSAILKVRRICGDGVGVYANGLEPYFALATTGAQVTGDENICKNYHIILNNGKLTVSKSTLKLKVKDVVNTYGEAFTAAQLQFELAEDDLMNEGIDDLIKNNINSYLTFDNTEYELETAKYEVDHEYALGFVGTVTATNFEFDPEILPGKFTVAKRPLKLRAKDQIVNLAASQEFNTVASATTIELVDATTIATGDDWTDLSISLEPATFLIGVNDINIITTNGNRNYAFEVVTEGAGKLNLSGMPEVTFTNYSDVEYYGGKPVTAAKLNMNDRDLVYRNQDGDAVVAGGKTYEWPYQKEEWFGLVLPFEISVADLSRAFGYAIVNRLDDVELMSDNKLNIKFKIEMDKIPANEPFVLKTSKAVSEINGTGIINFGTQNIVDPGTTTPSITKNGFTFYGTYNDVQLTKEQTKWSFLAGGDWKKVSATSSNHYNLKAFDCYFDRGDAAAREFVFTFQDIDGTATAIRNVSADGESKSYAEGWYTIDGMKLNAAPAQKGIYINNGKKVVIK